MVNGDTSTIGTNVAQLNGQRTAGDTLATFSIPAAGDYQVRLLSFNYTGAAEVEFYAQQGTVTSFAAGGSNWRLVGDSANGGLPVARRHRVAVHHVQGQYRRGRPDQQRGQRLDRHLDPGQPDVSQTEQAPYINYYSTGGTNSAHFYTGAPNYGGLAGSGSVADRAFPGIPIGAEVDDYTERSTGSVYIPASGNWTFDCYTDDGLQMWLSSGATSFVSTAWTSSVTDHFWTVNVPTAGWWDMTVVFYQRGGGSYDELSAVQGSYGSWSTAQPWRLVGDTAHGGLQVATWSPLVADESQDAERTVANANYQSTLNPTSSGTLQTVNFLNSGSTVNTHYTSDQALPGLTTGLDNYVGVATGTVTIGALDSLIQTFGVSSREGFRLTLTNPSGANPLFGATITGGSGGGTNVMYYASNRTVSDTFGTVTFPSAGTYNFTLEWYSNTSGSEVELYSAPSGSSGYTSWADGGTSWHLVGDTAGGGLAVPGNWAGGWATTIYKATAAVASLAAADTVKNSPSTQTSWTKTEQVPYINYLTTGADGHFYNTAANPGNINDRDVPGDGVNDVATVVTTEVSVPEFENYAAKSTGTFSVPTSGAWTFGVNTDEAYKLTVTDPGNNVVGTISWTNPAIGVNSATNGQPTNSFYTISNLVSGTIYTVTLEWMNASGGSEIELYTTAGTRSTWADSSGVVYPWSLLGDTSNLNSGYKYAGTLSGDSQYGSSAIQGTSPYGPTPTTYWQLNETSGTTVASYGGGGPSGTLSSNTTGGYTLEVAGPTGGFGSPNNAIAFSGSNHTGTGGSGGWVTDSVGQPLNNLSAFTVGAWIAPSVTPYQYEGILGQNGVMSIGFSSSTTLAAYTNFGSATASYTYGLNTWHYVSVVADANASDGKYLKLYIDGALAGSSTTVPTGGTWGAGTTNSFQLAGDAIMRSPFISANGTGDGGWYTGKIDEVAIWQSALPLSEEQNLGSHAPSTTYTYTTPIAVGTTTSGFNTTVYQANPNSGFGMVNSLDKALELISNPAYQTSATSATSPYINYMDDGSANNAHFDATESGSLNVADQAFPGLTQGLANYVGVATGSITIPANALTQTFGINSREGFRLTLTNPSGANPTFAGVYGGDTGVSGSGVGTNVMSYSTNRVPGDTVGTVNFLLPGTYNFTLEWYGNTSGSEVEFYSAPMAATSWAAGITGWHLVGDAANNGLPMTSNAAVTIYKSSGAVTSLTDADAAIASPAWTKADSVAYVNYLSAGVDGHFKDLISGDAAYGVDAVLALNPTVYWRYSETSGTTLYNSSSAGATYNAVLNTPAGAAYANTLGVAGPTGAFGNPNGAVAFSTGTSVGGWLESNKALLSGLSAFTMGAWIKPVTAPGAYAGIMGTNGVAVFGFMNSNTLFLYTNGGGSVTATYTPSLTEWHYIGVTVDGTAATGTNLKIYVDGVMVAQSGTQVANYGTSANTFQMAGDGLFRGWAGNPNSDGSWYVGQADELAVWTGVALTPAQMAILGAHPNATTFPGNKDVPGGGDNDFVAQSTSSIYIPAPGAWTFGVDSDDGFGLWLNSGTTTLTSSFTGTKTTSSDTLQTFNIPYAGWWDVKLVYFQRTAASQCEFYAAQGNYSTWARAEATGPWWATRPTAGSRRWPAAAGPRASTRRQTARRSRWPWRISTPPARRRRCGPAPTTR